MNPLVSVIVPIYQTEKYLKRCLDSILNQTYPHLEILLINDGSPGDPQKILAAYADPRIRYIEQPNGGQASARNKGLDLMTGDYVIMVDSDDYIAPELVATCLQHVEREQADLVIFTSYNLNEQGDQQYIPRNSGYFLTDAGTVPWNKFYRADLWTGLRFPTGYWFEDLGIVPVVALRASRPVKISEALYFYIVDRKDSQTNQQDGARFLDVIPMLENVKTELEKLGLLKNNETELERLYLEHLVYRTILRKIIYLTSKKERKALLKKIKQEMDQSFPNWRQADYQAGTGLTAKLKKWAVRFYLNGHLLIGDWLWKVPFEARRKKTGF
ncbi:glycosyltransferase family 2 protein [Listeria costaricensis]|uniref:glycosyltransferase family 2 protein n=1 Tax=Listeria costaricensis TaxID=2026604 RepID=UPI000C08B1DD|nr:glycosyltransferase family 2 protein [Listeria costaricensis]